LQFTRAAALDPNNPLPVARLSKPTWSPPSGGPEVRLKPDATGAERCDLQDGSQ
jgi:hypothetical protein